MKGILKETGLMDKIHAVSLKTHTVQEFRENYKDKAEEILCRGGGKYEKKMAAKEKDASKSDDKTA